MRWPCVQKGQEVSIGLFKLKGDHFAHYLPVWITRYTGIPQGELNLCMMAFCNDLIMSRII